MKRNAKLTNVEILNGLIQGDERVIKYLYKHSFYDVFLFIRKNSGTLEDSKDVFQDALLVVYQNIVQKHKMPNGTLQQHLFIVCKYIWAKKLKHEKVHKQAIKELKYSNDETDSLENTLEAVEKKKLFLEYVDLLDKRCRKLIRLLESGMSLNEIAGELHTQSIDYVYALKYKCREKLYQSIKNDDRFIELTKNNKNESTNEKS